MNSRLIGWLVLVGTASAMTPAALHAALPPDTAPPAQAQNADDTGNPYSVIVERNIFRLNPPPPPPGPDLPKVELPVVKITGFLNVGRVNRVMFVSQVKGQKDPNYYSLAENEKSSDGKLELVKIHDSKDAVDVINDGTPVTLTVEKDGNAPTTTPPPAPAAPNGPPGANPGSMPVRTRSELNRFSPGQSGMGPGGLPARLRRTQ
jgi:hypothetical protein